MPLVRRDYEGPEDLRSMQELARECWRLEGPYVPATVGDLAWLMYQHLDKLSETRIRLWIEEETGKARAWAWLWLPAALIFLVHPGERDGPVLDQLLDWFEREAGSDEGYLGVTVLEYDERTVSSILGRGYQPHDEAMLHTVRSLAEPITEPLVPEGFTVRTVQDEADLERRVEVHRAAFAPSRVVPESYRALMRAYPYRADLDNVVEAPDGTLAAFCLCWLDEVNRVGELEPVGTHPDYQRRGLARAVCLAGLRGLEEHGAETAVVYAVEGSGAAELYRSIGFRTISRHLELRRPVEPGNKPAPSRVNDSITG